ncbi:trans-sulfuration enzyme family protein [Mesoterricola sediminis]|uniref:L-methionine gamma-lyase n=1 Tax=Mesoterricola sediminis TaxID=2927980 RepID=A0AA48GV19_9BACT|nr:PLP-dependent aspartate aminotransferase family protein [Mesoterricola sediminis]BDU78324.1 L-methionine gamma-lyase [Mesoterricola sediminis]
MDTRKMGFNTKLVHAGIPEDALGSVTTPVYQTSTFAFRNAEQGANRFAGKEAGFIYSRIGNPTVGALEEAVAQLENGAGCTATSSGMGAVSSVYMALLNQGDHMVSTAGVYGPSRVLMDKHFSRFGVESTYLDTSDLEALKAAIRPNTKVVYVESPSNPSMIVTDIAAAARIAHAAGALLVVDNTFASPFLQRPLDLGADVVLHSITKFINGHADVVGGVIVAKTEAVHKQIRAMVVMMGPCMDPHQASLVARGLKTLSIRMERAQANAMAIAQWLERHPKVEWVSYLGLPSHPQYELVKRQMAGPGAMISFEVKGGVEAGARLMDNVKLAALAVSLGGVETLICHPASMTHASMGREARLAGGVTDGLVRYAVGIEDVEDLIADLDQALAHV